jgi:nucleotide-binding universal stress UspA family protein
MMSATSAALVPKPLPKIENILFPTDFSPCAQVALPYACVLAQQNNATLHMLNVVGAPILAGELGAPYREPAVEQDAARRDLARLAEITIVKAVQHETSIHRGSVWEVACRLAGEKKDPMIVMGTHGRRGVRQFVLGSVAEQVFRRSHCPVLTIGPGAPKTGPANGRFSTILLALDLSPESLNIMDWAHMLAVANESRLIIFHSIHFHSIHENSEAAMAVPNYLEDAVASARKRMSGLVPKDVPWTDIAIKIGSAAEKILETALDRNVDLIVIGARRGRTLAAHTPWAVAHEIVCAAHCPVLTVSH